MTQDQIELLEAMLIHTDPARNGSHFVEADEHAAIKAALSLVRDLPKAADGVPLIPGSHVWVKRHDGKLQLRTVLATARSHATMYPENDNAHTLYNLEDCAGYASTFDPGANERTVVDDVLGDASQRAAQAVMRALDSQLLFAVTDGTKNDA
jgi:hypothetical protein